MKFVSSLIILLLLGTMFVSLFHMSSGMDMTGSMESCPFMSHETVLCPMSFTDHVDAWKAAFTAVAPTIVLLLSVAGALAYVSTVAPHLLMPPPRTKPILLRQLRERTYTFSVRPLQELFADGILHPKLF